MTMSKPNYTRETLQDIAKLLEAVESVEKETGDIKLGLTLPVMLDGEDFGRLVWEDFWAWEPPA